MQKSWMTIFLYGVFTLSQVLSPLVPIALVVGQTMSSNRLTGMGVFCVNPKRIAISGKVRVYCFDKTGTLTKEGLDFIGLRELEGKLFKRGLTSPSEAGPRMQHGLATCHAVTQMGDTLVGNEVEVNMFAATQWTLEEGGSHPVVTSPDHKEALTIVKRFEFDHKRMTMSVLVRDGGGNVTIFCKGSAENVGSRCLPASIPEGYTEQSKKHALEGCYVISLGHRELGPMDDDAITRMDRDSAEQGLTWLGLILFRNELKPDTAQAIAKLKAGNVRCTMITGDNAQCGCYIARASGLVADDSCVLLADTTADGQVQWLEMVTTGAPLGPFTTEEVLAGHGAAELACTGTAFEALVASEQMQPLVTRMRIFSRMSPDGKVLAVELLIAKGLNV